MASFGSKSLAVRATLHPDLKDIEDETIKVMDHSLIEGARADARQDKLFAEKKTKLRAGMSKHNVGEISGRDLSEAYDSVPWDPIAKRQRWPDEKLWDLIVGTKGEAGGRKFSLDGVEVCTIDEMRAFLYDVSAFHHLKGIERGVAHMKDIPIRQGRDWDGDGLMRDQSFHDIPHTEKA